MDKHIDASRFGWQDLGQVAIGACVMAFPMAAAQETWDLGTELPLGRVLLFALASFLFLGLLIRALHHNPWDADSGRDFYKRVISTYLATLLISALLLFGIDRLDLLTDPVVGLKRTILVAFPASFAATVVDGLK